LPCAQFRRFGGVGKKKGRQQTAGIQHKRGCVETKSCRTLPSSRALLPRALPSAPARCPLPVRSSSACTAFCSRALPSAVLLPRATLCSSVHFPLLSRAYCRPHSIACHCPWLGSCHPCLSTGREGEGGSCSSMGRESCLLSAHGLLCSSAHGLLCSLFLGMLLCSSQLCLALES
jgi:hypothetical protein